MPHEVTREEIERRTPSGDNAVSRFLENAAGAFVVGVVTAFIADKFWLAGVCGVVAIILFAAGVYCPSINLRMKPRFAAYVNRIANDARYRYGAVLLFLLYLVITEMLYVRNLRRDLDTYVMPRVVTSKQADDLKEYLSHQKAHSVTAKVNSRDREATEYWGQLSNALKRTEWNVEMSTGDAPPFTLNNGLCIHEEGQNAKPKDPKNDPRTILESALRQAQINPNCGGGSAAGDYKLFILVGHRPLAIGKEPSSLYRLGRWLMSFGQ